MQILPMPCSYLMDLRKFEGRDKKEQLDQKVRTLTNQNIRSLAKPL